MTTHVAADALREVKGRVVDKVTGPVTVASGGRLALRGGGEVAVAAGGRLHAHAGGTHTITGGLVTLNPAGAHAPQVAAEVPPKGPSAWGPRPVPGPGPGRSTEDPTPPTKKELAQRAAPASMLAGAGAPAASATAPARSWVTVRLVDSAGAPVAGRGYELRANDGTIYAGRTDADGVAHVPDLVSGACTLTLDTDAPDADAPVVGAGASAAALTVLAASDSDDEVEWEGLDGASPRGAPGFAGDGRLA
jgi:pyruvate/2-oxoglutarate dehydrogenase complex dihydrolipoamide acyltransferase (E2) component